MWTQTYRVVGFLEPGVVKFGDKNLMIYISKDTIDRYSHRLKGKPVTVGHIEGITEVNAQQYSVGDVAACLEPGECIVTIRDEEANNRIKQGERFSCCWIPIKWGEGGTWHNIPYDRELIEMDFTHLAIVPDPRYENVEVFMNSKEHNNASLPKGGMGEAQKRLNKVSSTGMAARPHSTEQYATQVHEGRQAAQERIGSIPRKAGTPEAKTQQMHARISKKVSDFKNSLSAGQYAFLKKYIKEYNNAKVDEGLSVGQKREARMRRNTDIYEANTKPKNTVNDRINYRQSVRDFMPKGLHPQQNKMLLQRQYNNEVEPPDNSLERMDRINKYLKKREDRRYDKQYKTIEEPKHFAKLEVNDHFSGYKNCSSSKFRYKDGRKFNRESFMNAFNTCRNSKRNIIDKVEQGRQVANEYREGTGKHMYGGESGKLIVTKGLKNR